MSFIDLYKEFETELTNASHFVCDIECTQLGPDGAPDAYYRDNKPILIGFSFLNNKYIGLKHSYEYTIYEPPSVADYNSSAVLWGHNIKFDRAYLIKHFNSMTTKKFDPRARVRLFIDIGIATYLHSGHRIISPTLDKVAEYWGISERKLDTLKQGCKTQDIPLDDLKNYLKQDLKITRLVAEKILDTCTKTELYMYWLYTKASTLIGDIEQNGLYVDLPALRILEQKLEKEQELLLNTMAKVYYTLAPASYIRAYSQYLNNLPDIIDHIKKHTLLTAPSIVKFMCYSEAETTYKLPPMVRKAVGYANTKEVNHWHVEGLPKTDKCSIDSNVIEKAIDNFINYYSPNSADRVEYLTAYQKYVKNRKLLTTYVKTMIKCCEDSDSWRVHSKYNTCVTATSRLSSSSPNAQNIPQIIRQYIKAPEGKKIVTGDFKQIEVCALAFETQDTALLNDLYNNIDIHARAGSDWIPDRPLTENERRQVKGVVFGTIYGGGPSGLAAQTKLPKDVVITIQNALFKYYKTAFNSQACRALEIENNARTSKEVYYDTEGRPYKYGRYTSRTGHNYSFRQYYSDRVHKASPSISTTEAKDRPIQGMAAEWKMMYLALLDNILITSDTDLAISYRKEHLLLVADVHDELVWECPQNLCHQLTALLELLASDVLPYVIQSMATTHNPKAKLIVPPIVMSTKINDTWTK